MRSGIQEFRNNRNFLKSEYWEEFVDGTLMKKIVDDNGYGLKKMIQVGQRLDYEKTGKIEKETDEKNYFKSFKDEHGNQYFSLKELIEKSEGYLSWKYVNETVDDLTQGLIIMSKKGKDFINGDEWDNVKTFSHNEGSEVVNNSAKSPDGDWSEHWRKIGLERWCVKSGRQGNHTWTEKWYKKVF